MAKRERIFLTRHANMAVAKLMVHTKHISEVNLGEEVRAFVRAGRVRNRSWTACPDREDCSVKLIVATSGPDRFVLLVRFEAPDAEQVLDAWLEDVDREMW